MSSLLREPPADPVRQPELYIWQNWRQGSTRLARATGTTTRYVDDFKQSRMLFPALRERYRFCIAGKEPLWP